MCVQRLQTCKCLVCLLYTWLTMLFTHVSVFIFIIILCNYDTLINVSIHILQVNL